MSSRRSSRSIPRCSAWEASRVYPLTRVSSSGGGADATRSMVDRGPDERPRNRPRAGRRARGVRGRRRARSTAACSASRSCRSRRRCALAAAAGSGPARRSCTSASRSRSRRPARRTRASSSPISPRSPPACAAAGVAVAPDDSIPGAEALPRRRPVRQPPRVPRGVTAPGRLSLSRHGGCHQAWLAAAGRGIVLCAGRTSAVGHGFVAPA